MLFIEFFFDRLEVWPGYDSSILQFDSGPGVIVDVIHKMISTQTVYDIMQDLYQRSPRVFRDACIQEIVGSIVITR